MRLRAKSFTAFKSRPAGPRGETGDKNQGETLYRADDIRVSARQGFALRLMVDPKRAIAADVAETRDRATA